MLGHAKLVIRQDVYLCELTRRGKRGDTANVLVGVCVPRYDRYAQAHVDWNKAVQLIPDNGGYRLERAKLLYITGKKKEAALDFLKARDLGISAAEINEARRLAKNAPKVKE